MASCCRAQPCEEIFDWRIAKWDLGSYRRRGLAKLDRKLLESIDPATFDGGRVVEIGGGIGVLQAELLRQGAASGEVIELVSDYQPYAAELAADLGVAERTKFRVVDVLENREALEPADVVLLNRVICCSPDGLELVKLAAARTQRALLLSYPRDSLVLRFSARLQHRLFRLFRRQYRFYVRPTADVVAAATSAGLRLHSSGRGLVWEHATFVRG